MFPECHGTLEGGVGKNTRIYRIRNLNTESLQNSRDEVMNVDQKS